MVIVIALVTHPTKPLYGQGASAEIDSTELSVEYRSPSCIGCPEYRVSFRGIGSFEAACFGGCAVPGSHGEKFPRPEFLRLLAAFEAAKFFELPTRVGRCVDCGVVTVGYRDEHRIHEVTNLGFAQLPGLESLPKSLGDAAKPLEHYVIPNAKNYQALLDAGWSPNERVGPTDETMFNYAVRSLDDESVWLLLERGARVNDRALHDAASCAAPIFARLWKAAGLTAQTENARALLLRAAAGNCVDTVSFLLLKGIPVNAANPNTGLTPLMGAAGSDGQRAFDFLVEHGARLDARDANGNSVLWHAA